MDRNLFESYRYFFIILLVFLAAFFSGIIQGNDILHIVRNNFYTLAFVVLGIQIAYSYKNNFVEFFDDTVKIVGTLALLQMIIYTVSLFSLPFHIFVDNVLTKKIGYSLMFAGLGGEAGFGLKMVTGLTSVYIFLIPYGLFTENKKIKKYIIVILMAVMVSGSVTQYSIIFLYMIVFFLKRIAQPLRFIRGIFSPKIIFISVLIVLFIFSSGIKSVIEYKVENIINHNSTVELNSMNLRMIQARILFSEFVDEPFLGQGLGYDSIKYHSVRNEINKSKEIKKYNYSMYENQYLDILMKFGLIGAIIIFILFIFNPTVILFDKYMKSKNELYFSILVGYLGLIIFAGSNGNAFYAYTTMFVWGSIIHMITSHTILSVLVSE